MEDGSIGGGRGCGLMYGASGRSSSENIVDWSSFRDMDSRCDLRGAKRGIIIVVVAQAIRIFLLVCASVGWKGNDD